MDHRLYGFMFHVFQYLLRQLDDPILQHTYKEKNRVADILANFGCNMDNSEDFFTYTTPPSAVLTALEEDRLGKLFVRNIVPTTDYVLRQPDTSFCTTLPRELDSPSSTPSPLFVTTHHEVVLAVLLL
uniref:Uncharacterized protein LOC104218707 n=1 Tax=Nicotiana sylvestris TaxID=4096 RepID=A0A1U7VMI5_NICSY|nr:PREDICTED: uncharacterized protein LOC104218707 [Nicotiana sylvestris]